MISAGARWAGENELKEEALCRVRRFEATGSRGGTIHNYFCRRRQKARPSGMMAQQLPNPRADQQRADTMRAPVHQTRAQMCPYGTAARVQSSFI